MKPKVFISYSGKDKALAQRLKEDLNRAGCDPWQFDLSATPGTDAWAAILERIENSDFFVVILSQSAISSKAVLEEIAHAHYCSINSPESKPRMIPLMIEAGIVVPRQIVRAVRLQFRELEYNGDFDLLLRSLGIEDSPFKFSTELEVTFSRGREFNAEHEAGIYASSLINNNPEVSATFSQLSKDVQMQSGGRWKMPNPQTIVWRAETWRDSVRPQWVRVSEYTFLVVFALHFGYHTGYLTEKRVVLEISAFQQLKLDHAGEELVFHSDNLRLKFEGFRNVIASQLAKE